MFARMTRDRYLSDDELTAVMSAVGLRRHKNQPRDHAFFALIANVGIRPSEAMRLVRGDIHLDGKAPWIRVDRQHPKHAPQPVTELVLNRDVARVLRTYIRNIPASDRSVKPFPFTKRQAERLFHYYARKAGIREGLRLYSLRHTAGVRLLAASGDVRIVQAIMGHVRLKAAALYSCVSPDALRAAYLRLSPTD